MPEEVLAGAEGQEARRGGAGRKSGFLSSRLALAGLVALLVLGGGTSGDTNSELNSFWSSRRAHDLPYGGLAALAQEAPRATATARAAGELDRRLLAGLGGSEERVRPLTDRALEALIASFPWPYDEAIAVARCENRNLDPTIISASSDYGIFQINKVHAARVGGVLTRLLIAEVNVRVAYEIWSEQGWEPWTCQP